MKEETNLIQYKDSWCFLWFFQFPTKKGETHRYQFLPQTSRCRCTSRTARQTAETSRTLVKVVQTTIKFLQLDRALLMRCRTRIALLYPYLKRNRLTVRKNHFSLRGVINLTEWTGWLVPWRLQLSEYEMNVVHRQVVRHATADAFSQFEPNGVGQGAKLENIPVLLAERSTVTVSKLMDKQWSYEPCEKEFITVGIPCLKYSVDISVLLIRQASIRELQMLLSIPLLLNFPSFRLSGALWSAWTKPFVRQALQRSLLVCL